MPTGGHLDQAVVRCSKQVRRANLPRNPWVRLQQCARQSACQKLILASNHRSHRAKRGRGFVLCPLTRRGLPIAMVKWQNRLCGFRPHGARIRRSRGFPKERHSLDLRVGQADAGFARHLAIWLALARAL